MNIAEFKSLMRQKEAELYRDMPWRQQTDPYYVLVSELMLQQTQVSRVIPKFNAFIEAFPTVEHLSKASLGDVLRLWSGLGYNRRAKFLHEAAKKIMGKHDGTFPHSYNDILALPGVGQSTAGAIMAYAFNQPIVFIETNVRTVYFYHFFDGNEKISDKEIQDILEQTIDKEHPREFYWALMDYGTWLKKHGQGRLSKSKHYKKQAPLKGSVREVRGQILKLLGDGPVDIQQLESRYADDERLEAALSGLTKDGLVETAGAMLHLTK